MTSRADLAWNAGNKFDDRGRVSILNVVSCGVIAGVASQDATWTTPSISPTGYATLCLIRTISPTLVRGILPEMLLKPPVALQQTTRHSVCQITLITRPLSSVGTGCSIQKNGRLRTR
jgi:hypothetical protein